MFSMKIWRFKIAKGKLYCSSSNHSGRTQRLYLSSMTPNALPPKFDHPTGTHNEFVSRDQTGWSPQPSTEQDDSDDEEVYSRPLLARALDMYTPFDIFTLFVYPLSIITTSLLLAWKYLKFLCDIDDLGHFMETIQWIRGTGPKPLRR